jgi:hypothetical protein
MKVSIDGILGSAKRITSERQIDGEESGQKKRGELRSDSVEIGNRVNSRLDSIQLELKDLQSALTKSQVLRNGIELLEKDMANGERSARGILNSVTYEGKTILKDFLDEEPTQAFLQLKREQVQTNIREEVSKITRLQIEVENIVASNLADGSRADDALRSVSSALDKTGGEVRAHSNLNADVVMRLIR